MIRLLVCGARSGKTRATIGGECIRDTFLQPGYWRSDIADQTPYGILVSEPTFKMLKLIAWPLLLKAIPTQSIAEKSLSDRILFVRGVHGLSQIICASYEQGEEKIEGISLYRSYLDEVFQAPKSFFDEVLVRLADREGRLVMSGTPKPCAWIQDEIIDKAGIDSDIFFHTWKTIDNPYFPAESLDRLRKILPPKVFRRNFEASLESFDGQIYESFDRDIHTADFTIDINKYQVIWGSHDWGFSHNGSMYIYGLRDDDEVDVLHEVSESGIPAIPMASGQESWAGIMQEYQEQYEEKFDFFYAGPDRPENIASIRQGGVRIKGADNAVNEGIQFVSALMHVDDRGRSKLRIHKSNCPKLCKKLPMLRWKERADGSLSEEQLKRDDDEADSLRYGLFSMRRWFRLWQTMEGIE